MIYCPSCGKIVSFIGLFPKTCQFCFKKMGDSYITLEEEDFDYTYKPTLTETDIAFNDLFKKEKQ